VTEEPHPSEVLAQSLLGIVGSMHRDSCRETIRLPAENGAFPEEIILRPPPVVADANRLRNDILRACRTGQRTVLVNTANGGLLRLFCAQHVIDEVLEHSAKWAAAGKVSQQAFLAKWLSDYLPLIRVISDDPAHLSLLTPEEADRIKILAEKDPDDVPSATLALLLEAFYLSNDRPALEAVYGPDADLTEHAEWVQVLKAGGDAGELGKMLTAAANLTVLASSGIIGGVRRLAAATSPWLLLAAGFIAGWRLAIASDTTKQKWKAAGTAALHYCLGAFIAYEEVRTRFARVSPATPSWNTLATSRSSTAVLTRACMHTLARSMSDCSAVELAQDLPYLQVPRGEAKIRAALRAMDCFTEVWRGRWQLGHVAEPVARMVALRSASTDDGL
jgi:predicted nucleic acid-binding protein